MFFTRAQHSDVSINNCLTDFHYNSKEGMSSLPSINFHVKIMFLSLSRIISCKNHPSLTNGKGDKYLTTFFPVSQKFSEHN